MRIFCIVSRNVMAPHSEIPKVAIGPTQWTAGLYGTYDGCLAKPETGSLSSMLADRALPAGPMSASPELAAAIECMTETGDVARCSHKFDELKKIGGYKEPEVVGSLDKVTGLVGKAGVVKTVGAVGIAAMTFGGFRPFG